MDTRQLDMFLRIAQSGSMTATAKEMFISVPALAQQINRLEKEVGVALFSRSTHGMTLTPAGSVFLEDAQRVLQLTEQMGRSCRNAAAAERNRRVRIGSISGLAPDYYPQICRALARRHPEIRVEHIEDTPENLRTALLEDKIDLVEYYDGPLARHPQLQYVPILYEGRCCLMMPSHRLAGYPRIAPEDLAGERVQVLEFERVPGLREEMLRRCPEIQIMGGDGKRTGSFYAVWDLCREGVICLMPPHCSAFFAPLRAIPLDIPLTWSGGLICRTHPRESVHLAIEAAKLAFSESKV